MSKVIRRVVKNVSYGMRGDTCTLRFTCNEELAVYTASMEGKSDSLRIQKDSKELIRSESVLVFNPNNWVAVLIEQDPLSKRIFNKGVVATAKTPDDAYSEALPYVW